MNSKFHAGTRVVQIREYLGMNQNEFGNLIDKNQAMVSQYERRDRLPEVSIKKMSLPLKEKGINVNYLSDNDAPMLLTDVVKKEMLYKEVIALKKKVQDMENEKRADQKKIIEALEALNNKFDSFVKQIGEKLT